MLEFILNKIDTDIREKIKEELKEDKVHYSKSISGKKDIKDERNEETNINHKETHERKYITVDSIKYCGENISVSAEKLEKINCENAKGRILDKKK